MNTYEPLTKTTTKDGVETVVCRFDGTNVCQAIHKPNGCKNCPVLAAILKQLNVFEQIYMEEEDE